MGRDWWSRNIGFSRLLWPYNEVLQHWSGHQRNCHEDQVSLANPTWKRIAVVQGFYPTDFKTGAPIRQSDRIQDFWVRVLFFWSSCTVHLTSGLWRGAGSSPDIRGTHNLIFWRGKKSITKTWIRTRFAAPPSLSKGKGRGKFDTKFSKSVNNLLP